MYVSLSLVDLSGTKEVPEGNYSFPSRRNITGSREMNKRGEALENLIFSKNLTIINK